VKAHPAFPQLDQIERARPQAFDAGVAAGVERGVAEPAADDDPQRAPEEQVVGVALRHRAAGGLDHPRQVPVSQHDPGEVGERIKPQFEEPEVDSLTESEVLEMDGLSGLGQ
jgi:hypothetical protein